MINLAALIKFSLGPAGVSLANFCVEYLLSVTEKQFTAQANFELLGDFRENSPISRGCFRSEGERRKQSQRTIRN